MYLIDTITDKAEMQRKAPLGPGLTEEQANQTEKVEVWGSSFNDPGDDFCLFRGFNANGGETFSRRVSGY